MLQQRIKKELEVIKSKGLYRQVRDLAFIDNCHARDRSGKEYLVLSSNNYLGLTDHPDIKKAAQEALAYGSGSTGSRLTTGGVFAASSLERELAEFKHTEDALIFNTGYMTNLGVIFGLARPGDIIFSDELNHASIIDGCRISQAQVVVYKHSDMTDLAQKLEAWRDHSGEKFIVSDGVFSMDGDIAPLPELVRLKQQYGALLLIDDAHAVGVLGADGAGTASYYHLQGQVDLQVGTLSKSLASEGGYVAGPRLILEYLRNKSRPFIFSTALTPVDLAMAQAALRLLRHKGAELLRHLQANTALARELLSAAHLPVLPSATPIIPLLVGDATSSSRLAECLYERGIILSAIRPPTVAPGESRLRLTVTAGLSAAKLTQAMETLIAVWQEQASLSGK